MLQSFLTPQLAEFDDVFTETDWSLCLYRQLGPAGDFVWARSAVPSRDRSKQVTEMHPT